MTWFPLWGKEPSLYGTAKFKGLATLITGPDNSAAKDAARQQAAALAQQQAVQARAQQAADAQQTDLSGQLASQRRAIAARRAGGQLSYAGFNNGLKTTFGG